MERREHSSDGRVVVRSAEAADAQAVAAIWAPIIRDTVVTFYPHIRTPEEVAAMIADRQGAGHAFMVAEVAGAVVGFASYSQFRGGPGYARSMEHTVNLAADARGQGVGAALMRAIEDHAALAGHHALIGAVTASNVGSLAFHRRLGFTEVGRIPGVGWKFGRFHDLVLVHKEPRAQPPTRP